MKLTFLYIFNPLYLENHSIISTSSNPGKEFTPNFAAGIDERKETPCIWKESERKGQHRRRECNRDGEREIKRETDKVSGAHASLVVGVGNVLTHERN